MRPRLARAAGAIGAALLAAAPLALPLGSPLGAQGPGERGEADVEARARWLEALRVGTDGVTPADRAIAAWEQARRLPVAAMRALDRQPGIAAGPVGWRPVGPFGFISSSNYWISGPQADAGRVAALALDPRDPAVILVGSAGGGLWRGAGTSWQPLTDAECSTAVGAVAVDPVDPRIVYVGTGERTGSSGPGCGLLRSTDGGATWTRLGADPFAPAGRRAAGFARLVIDPRTAGTAATTTLIAATDLGVFRSEDGGERWTRVLAGAAWDVVASTATPGTYFASLTDASLPVRSGVYRSADGGATWTRLGGGWPAASNRVELAVSPADPGLVLAAVGELGTRRLLGLLAWRETEGEDAAWRRRGAEGLYDARLQRGDFGTQADYSVALAIDPADASRVLLGGIRLFASTDSGATFARVADNVHSDWQDLVFDARTPGRVVGASDGGVFVSGDGGVTWTSRNAGLQTAQFYPGVAAHPSDPSVILGGTQDNGTLVASSASLWESVATGDGGYTAISPANPRVAWISSYWSGGATLYRRGPETFDRFVYRPTNIASTDRAQFFPPLVIDAARPASLYFGTYRLWRTVDDGLTWLPASGDLTRGSGTLTTIAVAGEMVYTGASDGAVFASADTGRTFVLRAGGLPNRRVTRIVVDPADARRALATVNGYGTGHVFQTTDGGATWRDASGNLPDGPVYSALVLREDDWLVGTDYGVLRTTDGGATWSVAAPGLPSVMVTDLLLRPAANDVLAATHGRGLFSLALVAPAPVLRGDVNRDGTIDAADALIVAQSLAGVAPPDGVAVYPAGDVDCNGVVDATDVVIILRHAAGLPTPGACVGETR